MNLSLSRDGISVETEREDADLARAGSDAIESALELGTVLGVVGRGPCAACGDTAPVRPFPLKGDDGGLNIPDLCADCQLKKVEELIQREQAAAERENADAALADQVRQAATEAGVDPADLLGQTDDAPEDGDA